MKQTSAKVTDRQELLPGLARTHTRSLLGSQILWLECPEIAGEARPGQFVMVRCGDCVLPRPLSIHQVNDRGELALFFAVWEDGKGTGWLAQREIGDKVELFGPLGNGFSINPDSHHLLLVAGGIGIAPLYFLAQKAANDGQTVKLLQGVATASQLYPEKLLPSGVDFITSTENGTAGKRGLITDFWLDLIGWADQVFACGPAAMYRTMTPHAALKTVQVSLEMRMGCGLGVCYGCTVKTKSGLRQVCKDGPVFALDDVLWDEVKC